MRSAYRFDHAWHVDASPARVLALAEDVAGYPRWWPSVALLGGDAAPGARRARLAVRAPLGYRLRIVLAETASEPGELRATIDGDLEGWCRWRVTPEGDGSRVDFAQEVVVRAPLLRLASPLLHGLLARQHGAVMRDAERGMRAALAAPRTLGGA